MDHADRLVALVLQLQSPEWQTAARLGEAVGVSQRTIYRDVQVLAAAGVPVEGTRGHGYRLREGYLLAPLVLTRDEATALLAQTSAAPVLPTEPADRAGQAARMKLRALLPASATAEAASLAGEHRAALFAAAESDAAGETAAILQTVRAAVRERRALCLEPGTEAERWFEPYGFVERFGQWVVVGAERREESGARQDEHADVRAVRLAALARARLTDARFERPSGYASGTAPAPSDLAVRVVVRFVGEAVSVARAQALPPGAFAVAWEEETTSEERTLAFSIARADEAIAWVLGFGSFAEVLAPASLRAHLAREARRLAERYRTPEPTLF